MKTRLAIYCIMLLIFSITLSAQTANNQNQITSIVLKGEIKKPDLTAVASIWVGLFFSNELKSKSLTGDDGIYYFNKVIPGEYRIEISKDADFTTITRDVVITLDGQDTIFDIEIP